MEISHSHPEPAVTLVVPMRDEQNSIAILLQSIQAQTLEPAEVILVDGGSTDQTVRLAREAAKDDRRIRILEAGPAWPGRARNAGVRAASHDWIAFTDAGITLDRNWLGELVAKIRDDPGLDVVYGNYEPRIQTFFERCAALTYVAPKTKRAGELIRGPLIASCLVRKATLLASGGFPDFRAAEDLILMEKLETSGCRIAWQPQATVYWNLQPTMWKTFQRFRLYSRHNVYAGRERYWHFGVLRQYLALSAFLIAGLLVTRWLLLVPLIGLFFRAFKSIWQRRERHSPAFTLNPVQLCVVSALLLTLDIAMFTGWTEALVERILRRGFFAAGKQAA